MDFQHVGKGSVASFQRKCPTAKSDFTPPQRAADGWYGESSIVAIGSYLDPRFAQTERIDEAINGVWSVLNAAVAVEGEPRLAHIVDNTAAWPIIILSEPHLERVAEPAKFACGQFCPILPAVEVTRRMREAAPIGFRSVEA